MPTTNEASDSLPRKGALPSAPVSHTPVFSFASSSSQAPVALLGGANGGGSGGGRGEDAPASVPMPPLPPPAIASLAASSLHVPLHSRSGSQSFPPRGAPLRGADDASAPSSSVIDSRTAISSSAAPWSIPAPSVQQVGVAAVGSAGRTSSAAAAGPRAAAPIESSDTTQTFTTILGRAAGRDAGSSSSFTAGGNGGFSPQRFAALSPRHTRVTVAEGVAEGPARVSSHHHISSVKGAEAGGSPRSHRGALIGDGVADADTDTTYTVYDGASVYPKRSDADALAEEAAEEEPREDGEEEPSAGAPRNRFVVPLTAVFAVQCAAIAASFAAIVAVVTVKVDETAHELIREGIESSMLYAAAQVATPFIAVEELMVEYRARYYAAGVIAGGTRYPCDAGAARAALQAAGGVAPGSPALNSSAWLAFQPSAPFYADTVTALTSIPHLFAIATIAITDAMDWQPPSTSPPSGDHVDYTETPPEGFAYSSGGALQRTYASAKDALSQCSVAHSSIYRRFKWASVATTRPPHGQEFGNLDAIPIVNTSSSLSLTHVEVGEGEGEGDEDGADHYIEDHEGDHLLGMFYKTTLANEAVVSAEDGPFVHYTSPLIYSYFNSTSGLDTMKFQGDEALEDVLMRSGASSSGDSGSPYGEVANFTIYAGLSFSYGIDDFYDILLAITPPAEGAHTALYDLSSGRLIAATDLSRHRQYDRGYDDDDEEEDDDDDSHDGNADPHDHGHGHGHGSSSNKTLVRQPQFYQQGRSPSARTNAAFYRSGIAGQNSENVAAMGMGTVSIVYDSVGSAASLDGAGTVLSSYIFRLERSGTVYGLVQSTPKHFYFSEVARLIGIIFALGVVCCAVVVLICVGVAVAIRRGVGQVLANMGLAAQMKNDRTTFITTALSEVNELAKGFGKMNAKLLEARAYLPQHMLLTSSSSEETGEEEDGDGDDGGGAEGRRRGKGGDSDSEAETTDGRAARRGARGGVDAATTSTAHTSATATTALSSVYNTNGSQRRLARRNIAATNGRSEGGGTATTGTGTGSSPSLRLQQAARHVATHHHPSGNQQQRSQQQQRDHQHHQHVGKSLAAGAQSVLMPKRVTILALNARGFHTAASPAAPYSISSQANALAEVISTLASTHRGVVDAFHGDHFVLSFNAVRSNAEGPLKACRCALDAIAAVGCLGGGQRDDRSNNAAFCGLRGGAGRQGIHQYRAAALSIGIASGRACVGHLGTATLKRLSIIGPAYGKAIALERLCRRFYPVGPSSSSTSAASQQEPTSLLLAPTQCLVDASAAGDVRHQCLLQLVGGAYGAPFAASSSPEAFIRRSAELQQTRRVVVPSSATVFSPNEPLPSGPHGVIVSGSEANDGAASIVARRRRTCSSSGSAVAAPSSLPPMPSPTAVALPAMPPSTSVSFIEGTAGGQGAGPSAVPVATVNSNTHQSPSLAVHVGQPLPPSPPLACEQIYALRLLSDADNESGVGPSSSAAAAADEWLYALKGGRSAEALAAINAAVGIYLEAALQASDSDPASDQHDPSAAVICSREGALRRLALDVSALVTANHSLFLQSAAGKGAALSAADELVLEALDYAARLALPSVQTSAGSIACVGGPLPSPFVKGGAVAKDVSPLSADDAHHSSDPIEREGSGAIDLLFSLEPAASPRGCFFSGQA